MEQYINELNNALNVPPDAEVVTLNWSNLTYEVTPSTAENISLVNKSYEGSAIYIRPMDSSKTVNIYTKYMDKAVTLIKLDEEGEEQLRVVLEKK